MVSFGNWKVQDLENACQKLYQATQLIQAFILIITAGWAEGLAWLVNPDPGSLG
jgi:hypothetical protein